MGYEQGDLKETLFLRLCWIIVCILKSKLFASLQGIKKYGPRFLVVDI
jgi:hypothetical protein